MIKGLWNRSEDQTTALAPAERQAQSKATLQWLLDAAYPGASETMKEGGGTHDEAVALGLRLISSRFPNAVAAFGWGEALSGAGKGYARAKFVITLPQGKFIRNRCVVLEGQAVEFQAFGLDSAELIVRYAKRTGNPTILHSLKQAEPIYDPHQLAYEIKSRFEQAYDEGPDPAANQAVDHLRYRITDQLLDIGGDPTRAASRLAGAGLSTLLVRLLLTQARRWRRTGIEGIAACDEVMEGFSQTLESACTELLCRSDPGPLFEIALEVLDRAGGPIWSQHLQAINFPD